MRERASSAISDSGLTYWLAQDPRPESFVYVIQAEGDDPVKIGVATDVRARIATLQTGNPRPLRLLHVLVGDGELEWHLHQRFHAQRLVGEWFTPAVLGDGLIVDLENWTRSEHEANGRIPAFTERWPVGRRRGQTFKVRHVEPTPVVHEPTDAELREHEEAQRRRTREEFEWAMGQ